MKPKWLIEKSKFDESYIKLYEEVKKQDMIPHIQEYDQRINYQPIFNDNECVVFQGGMFFALHLLKNCNWYPLAWLTLDHYKCSNYYSYLGKYLLNDNYVIMPNAEVFRNIDKIFNQHFPKSDGVFIRPDTGVKTFNAKVHGKKYFKESYGATSIMNLPESLVVISDVKTIKAEWRFISVGTEIITGSKYKENTETHIEEGFSLDAFKLAHEIAGVYQPDPVFVIDICRDGDDNFKLVELNSFSCAGLYACDIPIIVERVSDVAVKEWKEIHGV